MKKFLLVFLFSTQVSVNLAARTRLSENSFFDLAPYVLLNSQEK